MFENECVSNACKNVVFKPHACVFSHTYFFALYNNHLIWRLDKVSHHMPDFPRPEYRAERRPLSDLTIF